MSEEIYKILDRHRKNWNTVDELKNEALQFHDIDTEKSIKLMEFAKLVAETIMIVQAGERDAYAIDGEAIELIERALFVKNKRMSQCK